jgi:hypothetical protein
MAKTLKDFLEGYLKVKSADEQKFIDKHVTAKNPDRNGNGDDVFKGNTKPVDRRKDRKGYNPGEDEKVYEELKGNQHKIDANKNGKVDAHDFHLLRKKKKVAEEAEQIDELSHDTLRGYRMKAKSIADHGGEQRTKGRELAGRKSYGGRMAGIEKAKVMAKEEVEELDETAKIVAHLQKRYGDNIRKSHVRSAANDFGVDASKLARAVRTKLGKNMLDEEQIDEISATTKDSYAQKAGKQLPGLFNKSGKDADSARKYYNRKNTVRKIANEEVEELDEKLTAKTPMGTYIKDFKKSDAPQFKGKSQDKRRVMAIAAKLSAERGGKPLRKEERLQNRINDLTETHQRTLMHVFEKLSEDNKSKFLEACDTPEGVEQMLDFAINNRGE